MTEFITGRQEKGKECPPRGPASGKVTRIELCLCHTGSWRISECLPGGKAFQEERRVCAKERGHEAVENSPQAAGGLGCWSERV